MRWSDKSYYDALRVKEKNELEWHDWFAWYPKELSFIDHTYA